MIEIEVKILEVKKDEVERKLKKLGAKKAFCGIIKAVIMDYSDLRLKKRGELLRLRRMVDEKTGEVCFLTYKIKKTKSKKAKRSEEIELEVENFEKIKRILELIGLKKRFEMNKHRTSYHIEKTHFEFDKYLDKSQSHVPYFLEIESPSVKEVYKYAKKLGFKDTKCLAWSSWDVLDYYKNKK